MKYSNKIGFVVTFITSCSIWAGSMGGSCDPYHCRGFGVGAKLLILQPDFSSHAYIGSTSTFATGLSQEHFVARKIPYDPGFMIEAFYNFASGKDINLNWYYFSSTYDQALANGINVFDSPFYNDVNLKSKSSWNAVNLEFGNTLVLDSKDKLRFHGGIQYANMDMKYWVTGHPTITGTGIVRSQNAPFSGTGIRGGADYTCNVGYGFAATFDGAFSLLLGSHSFDRSYEIYTSFTPAYNNNSGTSKAIVTEIEGKIGGTYSYATMYNLFRLDAGWMINNYFSPIEVANYGHHGRTKESNFSISGAYVGLRWSGDAIIKRHLI